MKKPWYVRRLSEFDPFASKHSGGRQKRAKRKSIKARVARAITRNWPRGR